MMDDTAILENVASSPMVSIAGTLEGHLIMDMAKALIGDVIAMRGRRIALV